MVAAAAAVFPNPPIASPSAGGPLPGQRLGYDPSLNGHGWLNGEVLVPIGPTGSVRENLPREFVTLANDTTLSNAGVVLCSAIDMVGSDVVAKLGVGIGGTAAGAPTHSWAALLDSTLHVLAVSADGLTGAIASGAEFQFTMGAAFTVVSSGRYYVAVSVSATTAPSLLSKVDGGVAVATLPPVLCGTAGTQATPPALGAQLNSGALTPVAARFWARVL